MKALARDLLAWLRAHAPQAALSAALGAALGYVFNVALMMFLYDGYQVPSGQPAVGQGNLLWGSLIWGVVSMLGFGLFGYWRAVGTRRFVRDLASLPAELGRLVKADGRGAWVHLLWGAATSLMLMFVLSPWLALVIGVGLLGTLPSVLGRFVCGLATRAWSTVIQKVSPAGRHGLAGPVSMGVGVLGGSAAVLLAFFLPSGGIRLGLAAACGAGAWALSARGGARTPSLLLWAACLALVEVPEALAHDGGWREYTPAGGSRSLGGWLRSEGAVTLLGVGLLSVPSSAGGAALGTGLGHVMGRGGWGDWYGESSPGTAYTQDLYDRVAELYGEVTDPALFGRLERMATAAAETGRIDPRELEAVRRQQDRLAERRRREIDADHARFREGFEQERQAREEQQARQRARDEAGRRRLDDRERALRDAVARLDDPVTRQHLEDFLDRHRNSDPKSRERAMAAVRAQALEAAQQRRMGEAEQAAGEAEALGESEAWAEGVRDWSMRANRTIAKFLPGGQAVLAAQSTLYGGIQGYDEGGLGGALARTAANLADNYTEGGATAVYETIRHGGDLDDLGRRWGRSLQSTYDPSEYVRRVREARTLGEMVDLALDAADAGEDLLDKARSVREAFDEGPGPASRDAGSAAPPVAEPPARVRRGRVEEAPPGGRPEGVAPTTRRSEGPAPPDLDQRGNRSHEGAEARAAWERYQEAENTRRDAEADAVEARHRADRARVAAEEARSRMVRDPNDESVAAHREARERRQRAEAAREASDANLAVADREAERTRQQFEEARERRLDLDPRRAAKRADGRLDEARHERWEAEVSRTEAVREVTHRPEDEAARRRLAEASERLREARAAEDRAEAGVHEARQRLAGHRVVEERARSRVDGMIEQTFGAPPAGGRLVLHGDSSALGSEYRAAGAQPRDLTEVRDPASGVEVAVDPTRSPPGQLAGATTRSERLPTREAPEGMMGFDRRGDSHSLPLAGTAVHERVHAHTSPQFRTDHGSQINLNEGMTEHYTRQVRDQHGLTGLPQWDRTGHYDQQAEVAARLERVVGRETMAGAYFQGDTASMHRRLGEAMGEADPVAAEQSGRQALGTLDADMKQARDFEDLARDANRRGDLAAGGAHQLEANRLWRRVDNLLGHLEGGP